jgi:hypothetical protein
VLPELCHTQNTNAYCCVSSVSCLYLQVFGSAERLGTTANHYTVDGYLQRSAEYTSWTVKGESLAAVEGKLNKLSATWWQAKLARLPGLQVRTTPRCLYCMTFSTASEVEW